MKKKTKKQHKGFVADVLNGAAGFTLMFPVDSKNTKTKKLLEGNELITYCTILYLSSIHNVVYAVLCMYTEREYIPKHFIPVTTDSSASAVVKIEFADAGIRSCSVRLTKNIPVPMFTFITACVQYLSV